MRFLQEVAMSNGFANGFANVSENNAGEALNNLASNLVKVIHGSADGSFPVAGHTVSAARATFALNSAVCVFRTLVIFHPWSLAGLWVGGSLSHLSNFRGPAQQGWGTGMVAGSAADHEARMTSRATRPR